MESPPLSHELASFTLQDVEEQLMELGYGDLNHEQLAHVYERVQTLVSFASVTDEGTTSGKHRINQTTEGSPETLEKLRLELAQLGYNDLPENKILQIHKEVGYLLSSSSSGGSDCSSPRSEEQQSQLHDVHPAAAIHTHTASTTSGVATGAIMDGKKLPTVRRRIARCSDSESRSAAVIENVEVPLADLASFLSPSASGVTTPNVMQSLYTSSHDSTPSTTSDHHHQEKKVTINETVDELGSDGGGDVMRHEPKQRPLSRKGDNVKPTAASQKSYIVGFQQPGQQQPVLWGRKKQDPVARYQYYRSLWDSTRQAAGAGHRAALRWRVRCMMKDKDSVIQRQACADRRWSQDVALVGRTLQLQEPSPDSPSSGISPSTVRWLRSYLVSRDGEQRQPRQQRGSDLRDCGNDNTPGKHSQELETQDKSNNDDVGVSNDTGLVGAGRAIPLTVADLSCGSGRSEVTTQAQWQRGGRSM